MATGTLGDMPKGESDIFREDTGLAVIYMYYVMFASKVQTELPRDAADHSLL
jgi:hypothetical protein